MTNKLCLLSLITIAACGSDEGPVTIDAAPIDAMLGDPTKLVGNFVINLVESAPNYTSIAGVVNDKVPPEAIIWDVVTTDGDCRLLTPRVPFCSTPCGGTAVCVADNTCEPYATKQDVGTVTVGGVHTTSGLTSFDLVFPNPNIRTYQVPGAISLVYPGFAEGDAITVNATGSTFTPAFSLAGRGIAPLVVTSPDPALMRNTPVALTWTSPASGASQIAIKLDISHHGGSKGKIECLTADDGSHSLGAALVTQLLDLGAAGFPTIILERRATANALTTAGRVDLVIGSEIQRPVTVPGIISCDGDEDCTPPATCRADLTCG